MLQQRQRSRADWLVRGSSLVLVNAVYVVYSVEQSKRHTTHHTTEDFDDFWVVGGGSGDLLGAGSVVPVTERTAGLPLVRVTDQRTTSNRMNTPRT